MIQNLVADCEKVVASAKQVIEAGGAIGDDASVDLGVRRTEIHQKNAWMLRSHLE
jgi:starvation-inducible DNA-binding protein